MAPRIFSLALLLLVPLARADEVDDLVSKHMTLSRAPAMAIAIVKDGKVVRAQGYGLSNVEHNVPATPDTVFRVASMSKQFAAASMLLLADEGKVNLKDSVRTVLKDAPQSWQEMTFEHLLRHISGIPDIGSEEGFTFASSFTEERYLTALYKKTLKSKPGDVYFYSNPGYSVLGILVGRISGTPLEAFVQERFLDPAGLRATRYFSRGGIVPRRAAGYERDGDSIENALFLRPAVMQGSGGLMSTVLDFAKWDAALMTDTPYPKRLREIAWTPGKLNNGEPTPYGMGWFVSTTPHGKVVRHSGGTVGFTSNWIRYLDKKLTVIVLENVADGQAVKLSEALAELYLAGGPKP